MFHIEKFINILFITKFFSFFKNEFDSEFDMIRSAFFILNKRKYHNQKVYVHNLSHFDGIFLLNIISDLSKNINIIIKEGQIIDLQMKFAHNKYSINFRDSLLLLPDSLNRLASNFGCRLKGIFPYKFVINNEINLNYKGPIPDFKYFDNLTLEEYNNYSSQFRQDN